jgi:small subunit ribosomal protein S1
MEDRSGWRQVPAKDTAWWRAPGEDYWQAVFSQGEIVPEPVLPADPQDILYPFILESEAGSPLPGPAEAAQPVEYYWPVAHQALEQGELFSLPVVGSNRGGLLVRWNGLEGFVPASHLKELPRSRGTQDRATDLALRTGDLLTVRLIEVDEVQGRLVFSERAALAGPNAGVDLLNTLRPGDVCRGRILNLTSFGAFVDLGGVEGLIHISEISWDRLRHPGDMLCPGEEVQVQVLGVNPEEGRVALSLKRQRPNPWADADSRYHVGQVLEGTVTNVVSFGAFVRLEEGLEGLIHVSELAAGNLMNPRNAVREGERVRVRVLNVDCERRRLGLSLRQAHEDRWIE